MGFRIWLALVGASAIVPIIPGSRAWLLREIVDNLLGSRLLSRLITKPSATL